METNNHQITAYSTVLEKQFGKHGTLERARLDEEAYTSDTSQNQEIASHYLKVSRK